MEDIVTLLGGQLISCKDSVSNWIGHWWYRALKLSVLFELLLLSGWITLDKSFYCSLNYLTCIQITLSSSHRQAFALEL